MNTKQTIKISEAIELVLETKYDSDYEPDFLGKWADEPREWCVDRKLGVLLGEAAPEPIYSERHQELEDKMHLHYYDDKEITDEEYQELATLRKAFAEQWNEWNDHHGLKVLSDNLKSNWYDHRQFRYYYPPIENYEGDTEENKIKYCLQDHKRLEDLENGQWYFEGYEVRVKVNGLEIAEASLWGIESDGGREYHEEIWTELISECLDDLNNKLGLESLKYIKLSTELTKAANSLPEIDIKDLVKEIE